MSLDREVPIVLIGGGGHARVIADACQLLGLSVAGFIAAEASIDSRFSVPWLGTDALLDDLGFIKAHRFFLGLGDLEKRRSLGEKLRALGAVAATIVHPSATVSWGAQLSPGVFVAAGAVVGVDASIGEHVIVNTRAVIDHDCLVGAYAHIAPGSTLAGGVVCGQQVLVGTGAAVGPNLTIGDNSVIGIGSAVVKHVEADTVVAGCPARPLGVNK